MQNKRTRYISSDIQFQAISSEILKHLCMFQFIFGTPIIILLQMGNKSFCQPEAHIRHPSPKLKEESTSNTTENIENQEPTDLPVRINRQFKRMITASRNILIEPQERCLNVQLQLQNSRRSSKKNPIQMNDIFASLEDKMLKPVFQVFTRMKVKRPAFEMLQIDLKKFMKMKTTPITADYEIIKEIGKGGFGSVFKARQKKTNELRAIKMIKKETLDQQEKMNLINEFQILNEMDHPNIIKLYDIYDDQAIFYVVTQLCEGGNLLNFVNSVKMTEDIMRDVMVQLLSAVKYMHSFKYLHRDIKLQNIVLVKKIKNKDEKMQIKLIDFGISCKLTKPGLNTEPMGTLLYMSPESLDEKLQLASDIWSCGVLLYMMATRKVPYHYKNDQQLIQKILKCQIIRKYMQSLSVDLKIFIAQLLEKSYKKRMTVGQTLESPWIKNRAKKFDISQTKMIKVAKNLLDYDAKNNLISIIESYLVFKKINQSERQKLGQIFQQIDKDKSGIIQIQQLKRFYSQTSQHYDNDEVEELLKIMDKNRSGKIDFNEFIIAMYNRRKLFQLQSLEDAFDYFDKDKSGEISKKELEQILEGIKNEQIQYLFSELDKNHDQKISKTQFLNYLNNYQENNKEV